MDTADGLAVPDADRRLAVMADSRSGAFGVMAAIAILGLKTLALADLATGRGPLLATAMVWGRWGQVLAIARYSYLRPNGKGALHKAHLRLPGDLLIGLAVGVLLCGAWAALNPDQLGLAIGSLVGGVGAWLQTRLGGHTGDTYGATVEWTETLVICLGAFLTGFQG
jgi:adenosylcobinamide-GDP ribazoletransferase